MYLNDTTLYSLQICSNFYRCPHDSKKNEVIILFNFFKSLPTSLFREISFLECRAVFTAASTKLEWCQ